MTYRMIQVGTGGFGKTWCSAILPPAARAGLIKVVAAVDTNPRALETARQHLALTEAECFTSIENALTAVEADFCSIVVPPTSREPIVDVALAHNLDILCEKPLASSLDASVRIVDKVERQGRKMAVTMSHSHDQDKQSYLNVVKRHQPLDYVVARITNNARQLGSWGRYRHEMADPLLNETAYHHLDTVRALAGAPCESVFAQSWNPDWGDYAGHSQAHVMMKFQNGVRATYEGAMSNAVGLNGSPTMYIRSECRDVTIVLDHREIRKLPHTPGTWFETRRESEGEVVPLLEGPNWSHHRIIRQFVNWLDGGDLPDTNAAENLQTAALVFAAIESSHANQPVNVQEFLRQSRIRSRAAISSP